jgi:hypothetical protein
LRRHERRHEQLHELETKYAVQYFCGATLYINPTNAFGEDVTPPDLGHRARKKAGRILEAAKGVECDPQIGGGHVVSQEVDCAAPVTRNCRRFTRDFKSEAGLVVLRSPDEAVLDAAGNNQSKNLAIGRGSVRFKGSPRCLSLATYPSSV